MSKPIRVMGISASHNGAVCIVQDGAVAVAIQEERLSGVKRANLFGCDPALSIAYCLDAMNIRAEQLDAIVYCTQTRSSRTEHEVEKNPILRPLENRIPVIRIGHHFGHAMSGLARSALTEAAVMVIDGMGSPDTDLSSDEKRVTLGNLRGCESISFYHARAGGLRPIRKQLVAEGRWLPGLFDSRQSGMSSFNSVGGMYSAVAMQIFGDPMAAGKVMGLAPLGKARWHPSEFFEFINDYVKFKTDITACFTHNERWPSRSVEYADLAASVQKPLEELLLALVGQIKRQVSSDNLVCSGGVALNGVANERIKREGGFDCCFFDPSAEDSGPAIGAAFHGFWSLAGWRPNRPVLSDAFGRSYCDDEVQNSIGSIPGIERISESASIRLTAEKLAQGSIIGWFSGGAEFGPRALGHRSILCDPRSTTVKTTLNASIKQREDFRPFAPAVLLGSYPEWFQAQESDQGSPFMLRVIRFNSDRQHVVPAVVHLDGTGRVQTVSREVNLDFYELVRAFNAITGIPLVLNTSLNVAGEPNAERPEDALWLLFFTGLDYCFVDGHLYTRQSAFETPLDYFPTLSSRSRLASSGEISVTSAWRGSTIKTNIALNPLQSRVCGLVDGKTKGHDLLSRLDGVTGPQLTRTLCILRRMHVIEILP